MGKAGRNQSGPLVRSPWDGAVDFIWVPFGKIPQYFSERNVTNKKNKWLSKKSAIALS